MKIDALFRYGNARLLSYGKFDELKYRRYFLNRPFESIRLLPLSVREAVDQLEFGQNCLV